MNYETVIGLEIHAELNTKSKIFCECSTKFASKPNENTCPVCTGLPGTLPVLNEEVVNLAIKAGIALNCNINMINKMDRKNYFYPDLPKAYQISQYDLPICTGGFVEFECEGKTVKVRINRIHIEEDAGKLIHLEDEPYSLIDYNRAGVPLIEIVSEPDMHSPLEAVTFLRTLKSILEYCEISDCRMEQGSLRCDANISLRPAGSKQFYTKVEIKNINSFKELQKALEDEENRQRKLYQAEEGYKVIQETRRWDSLRGKTVSMRTKEEAHDYRYFPEPDLLPVIIKENTIKHIKGTLPELPAEKSQRFIKDYNLTESEVEILVRDKALSEFFENAIKEGAPPKAAANWILGDLLRIMNDKKLSTEEIPVKPAYLSKLIALIEKGSISNTAAKGIFKELFVKDIDPEELIKAKGLEQISSEEEIIKLVEQAFKDNPQSVEDFKNGKTQAVGFLIGQVMKASKGKANPKLVKELVDAELRK
ncbi:MAG TPA: Asp-tRNA(Asn)/Glu-tRNA(Gln) amidotransferase subunit GatB [Clostridiaceae bacterium]|nr:Asp-tRNA(Asn)/Glu-tRNA(Gln) amidotransferase subunit GatB [Clostridiaceae bacterium]